MSWQQLHVVPHTVNFHSWVQLILRLSNALMYMCNPLVCSTLSNWESISPSRITRPGLDRPFMPRVWGHVPGRDTLIHLSTSLCSLTGPSLTSSTLLSSCPSKNDACIYMYARLYLCIQWFIYISLITQCIVHEYNFKYTSSSTCYKYILVYMYIHIHTYIHTYIHACLHTSIQDSVQNTIWKSRENWHF